MRNDFLGRLEVQTLGRLARDPGGYVGLRFLDEATRTPKTARRLCARSEPALIAAVGLDPRKREQALALFLKRLDETDLLPAQRGDIALTALELIDRAGPDMGACEKAVVEAMKACSHEPWLRVCANHLVKSAERLEPATAGRLILEMLAIKPSSSERAALAVALCGVAGRLEPDAASRIILKVLAMKLGFYESGRLAEALAKVTVRQHPNVARQSCREALQLLTEALTRTRGYVQWIDGVGLLWDADDRSKLGSGFAALATRLPRGEAIRFLTESLNRRRRRRSPTARGDGPGGGDRKNAHRRCRGNSRRRRLFARHRAHSRTGVAVGCTVRLGLGSETTGERLASGQTLRRESCRPVPGHGPESGKGPRAARATGLCAGADGGKIGPGRVRSRLPCGDRKPVIG